MVYTQCVICPGMYTVHIIHTISFAGVIFPSTANCKKFRNSEIDVISSNCIPSHTSHLSLTITILSKASAPKTTISLAYV